MLPVKRKRLFGWWWWGWGGEVCLMFPDKGAILLTWVSETESSVCRTGRVVTGIAMNAGSVSMSRDLLFCNFLLSTLVKMPDELTKYFLQNNGTLRSFPSKRLSAKDSVVCYFQLTTKAQKQTKVTKVFENIHRKKLISHWDVLRWYWLLWWKTKQASNSPSGCRLWVTKYM